MASKRISAGAAVGLVVLGQGALPACSDTVPSPDGNGGALGYGGSALTHGGKHTAGGSAEGGAARPQGGADVSYGGVALAGGAVTDGGSSGEAGASAGVSTVAGSGAEAGGGGVDSSGGVPNASGGVIMATGGSGDSAGAAGAAGESSGEQRLYWLGACEPLDLSDDGSTVLTRTGIWNAHDGWVALPQAGVMSGDGQVVFGYTSGGLYRWTRAGGIEELGAGPTGPGSAPFFGRSLVTTRDGSVLIGPDGLRRWAATGVVQSNFVGNDFCDSVYVLSSDGAVAACTDDPTGTIGTNAVFVFRLNSAGEYERLIFPEDSPYFLGPPGPGSPTAISGDGHAIAVYAGRSTGYGNLDQCLLALGASAEACHYSNQLVTDLDYSAQHAVGQELPGTAGGRCPLGTFYWSAADGIRFLNDALFEHGLYVDVPAQAPAQISADGRAVLSVGTRHLADGSSHEECFLAKLSEAGDFESNGQLALANVTALDLSASGGCAAVADGHVLCWGEDARQLVDSDVSRAWSAVTVPGVSTALGVAADADHSCALTRDGHVQCWGKNDWGELGDGSAVASAAAVTVVGIDNATQVSVRHKSSCALLADGTVACWGNNDNGQLGDGTLEAAFEPRPVPGLDHVVQLVHSGGSCEHEFCFDSPEDALIGVCALRDDHTVWCWGGQYLEPSTPSLRLNEISQISDDTGAQLCWIQRDGVANCEIGIPQSFGFECGAPWLPSAGASSVPALPADVRQIVSNSSLLCLLLADGTVQCAGFDATGGLGRGQHHLFGAPLGPVTGIEHAQQIAVGNQHACALLSDGSVRCWGRDDAGQLGNARIYTNPPYGLALPGPVLLAP